MIKIFIRLFKPFSTKVPNGGANTIKLFSFLLANLAFVAFILLLSARLTRVGMLIIFW